METGLLGTRIGVLLGMAVIRWAVHVLLAETVPEFGLVASISGRTVLAAITVGVAAVALAPVLTMRRMGRMDLPSTLRVMEWSMGRPWTSWNAAIPRTSSGRGRTGCGSCSPGRSRRWAARRRNRLREPCSSATEGATGT